jgi:hypothetical protein
MTLVTRIAKAQAMAQEAPKMPVPTKYWKVEALTPDGKRRVLLRGDWCVRLRRRALIGTIVDAEGDEITKKVVGGLSIEHIWIDESDVVGKCIEMEMSRKYARLVPKKGEITNSD